jgi:hypothetical protein
MQVQNLYLSVRKIENLYSGSFVFKFGNGSETFKSFQYLFWTFIKVTLCSRVFIGTA